MNISSDILILLIMMSHSTSSSVHVVTIKHGWSEVWCTQRINDTIFPYSLTEHTHNFYSYLVLLQQNMQMFCNYCLQCDISVYLLLSLQLTSYVYTVCFCLCFYIKHKTKFFTESIKITVAYCTVILIYVYGCCIFKFCFLHLFGGSPKLVNKTQFGAA